MKTDKTTTTATSQQASVGFYIVGVGASAGGLDAFISLIKEVEPNAGLAYVMLQHLDPTHHSLLPSLLRKWAKIPVVEITDGLEPQPNYIYVQPSNKLLAIERGKFVLQALPQEKQHGAILIDHFFKSLAEHHGKYAVGVILSGTASDGTKGLQLIKKHGGITFAQDEASAQWKDMPHNAAEAGAADYILSPTMIPSKIMAMTHPDFKKDEEAENDDINNLGDNTLKKILELLHKFKGRDFGQYKKTTIGRRIERRMSINNIKKLSEYHGFLKNNKKELEVLYNDLLIPVTEFFRDHESFEYLCSTILPKILANKAKGDLIRIWVAGCSTGEEAYSMAICFMELLKKKETQNEGRKSLDLRLQIIATDISQPSLTKARGGIYAQTDTRGLSNERLRRFFTKTTDGYQIKKEMRGICLFAEHNFLSDPPFSNMDLISCRNVMIYMEDMLKVKAQTNFHYGLRPDGWLWLGKSEANTASSDLFSISDKTHRFFKRQDVPAKITIQKTMRGKTDTQTIDENSGSNAVNLEKIVDAIVLENYTPTGVVVDSRLEIVHYRGNTQDYLVQKSGRPSHNLLKLAKAGLGFELRNIIERARQSQQKITKTEVPLNLNEHITFINLEAIPLEGDGGHVLVIFRQEHQENAEIKESEQGHVEYDNRDRRIFQLERELVQVGEDMRAIVEKQEVANEELQSANEELMSSSEELQTLNEELETSKEELQSANEEITVANQELLELNGELIQERNYAETIIKTLREPLIILNNEMRVQSANRAFYANFEVTEKETVGRSIFELGNNQWDIPKLRKLLEDIIPEREIIYDYEVTHDFEVIGRRTMLLNARQIKNEDQDKKLILLSIDDITERKKTRLELEESIQRYNELISSSSYMIAVLEGPDFVVRSANQALLNELGKGNIIGQPYLKAAPELEEQGLGDLLRKVYESGKHHVGYETPVTLPHDQENKLAYYDFVYQPHRNREGSIIGVSIIANEVTPRAKLNQKIKDSVHEFEEFIYSSPSMIAILKGEDFKIDIANSAILETWGKDESAIGKPLMQAVPELKGQGFDDLLLNVFRSGQPYHAYEVPATHKRNGKITTDYYDFLYQPQRDLDGKIIGVDVIANLVTPQAKFHRQLRESEEKFRNMADLIPDKITLANAEGQALYCNQSWRDYLGITEAEFCGLKIKELAHPDEYEKVKTAIKDYFAKGKDVELEARVKDAAGDYKWHLVRARPMRDEQGTILSWITATTQIHKIKLEDKRKEDFLKMASHELKTPVTSIKGYAQLLLSMLKEKKAEELQGIPLIPSLERINNQVSRLTRLISEMLDLSRVEEGKLNLQKEIFSMNELVEHNVQDIKYSSKESQISIVQKDYFKVNGDMDRLGQVLINFITNAIKYSPDDKHIEVAVYKTKEGEGAVAVKDHGIGIAKSDIGYIFQRFYRVSGENEETYAGFGIGLYLAQEIIERHGGKIHVKSKIGEGSEFIFTLPTID